jgi:aminomethyltransferase
MTAPLDAPAVTLDAAYRAAHEGAILVHRPNLGVLRFTGATRLDLIHRMSTQAVKDLPPGRGAATVLTTDIGRIVDRLILYPAEDSVIALTGENNANAVARYLMRFVFFNDDFHIEDMSAGTAVLAAYGQAAAARLASLFPGAADLPLHHWQAAGLAGRPLTLHRADPIAGDGYFLLCATADREPIAAALAAAGLIPAGEAAFDYLRVESGQPRFGRELTLDYIPLEANLWDDVNFKKGCYIGQEIIARMESRGRLAKKLVRLAASAPLTPGADLTHDGSRAGAVTSAASGPAGHLALAYVKTAILDANPTHLDVAGISARLLP